MGGLPVNGGPFSTDDTSSLLDKSQNMDLWQEYFDHPVGANMGRLQAMYAIGSIASLPIAPIVSDRFGRKMSIKIGCVLMIVASALQTAASGQPMFEGMQYPPFINNCLPSQARASSSASATLSPSSHRRCCSPKSAILNTVPV